MPKPIKKCHIILNKELAFQCENCSKHLFCKLEGRNEGIEEYTKFIIEALEKCKLQEMVDHKPVTEGKKVYYLTEGMSFEEEPLLVDCVNLRIDQLLSKIKK